VATPNLLLRWLRRLPIKSKPTVPPTLVNANNYDKHERCQKRKRKRWVSHAKIAAITIATIRPKRANSAQRRDD
jgi:hypothetical protein